MSSGAPVWLVALGDVALALGLFLVSLAIGLSLLRRLRCVPDRALERLCFSIAVGAGILSLVLLALGALGGFRSWTLAVTLILAVFVSRDGARAVPDTLAGSLRALRSAGIVPLAFASAVGAAVLLQALPPPVDWDSLMYHVRVPAQWLEAGRVFLPQDNLHASLAQLAHVLYVPMLAFGSASAPGVLSALFAVLLVCATYAFAQRFLHAETARWSPAMLWGSTLLALVAVTPRVDVTLALYLFLAHYALLLGAREPTEPRLVDLSALLLGFAIGVKHQALAYAAALIPIVLWAFLKTPAPAARRVRAHVRYAALVLLGALPWLAKNAILFSSPLYPVFSARRLEPWLQSLYVTRDLPSGFPEGVQDVLHDVREPFNLVDLFFAPGSLSVEGEAAAYFVSALLLALPLWVLFRRDSTLNALGLPALAYVTFILLVSRTTNLRYLIPAIAPLTLVAIEVLVRLAVRSARPHFVRTFLLVLAIVTLLPTARSLAHELSAGRTLAYLSGSVPRSDYLLRHREPEVFLYGRVVHHVNRALPPRSRILMILEARGFYLQRDVLQDNLLTNWPLLARVLTDDACLEGTAITHVLVNHAALRYYVRRGLDEDALRWGELRRFQERCLVLDYTTRGFSLYRLRRREAAPVNSDRSAPL